MSNYIRFHPILQNRLILSDSALPLPNFPSDFQTDQSNHQIIGQWDAGIKAIWIGKGFDIQSGVCVAQR